VVAHTNRRVRTNSPAFANSPAYAAPAATEELHWQLMMEGDTGGNALDVEQAYL
jgi:hypothetical protein